MTVYNDIAAALDGRLNTLGSDPIAWENLDFTPTIGTLYLRPNISPATTDNVGMADASSDDHAGFYQVSVFAPSGTGKFAATTKADEIETHFKRGTELTFNGIIVRVTGVSRSSGARDGSWFTIPVTINYRTIIRN